MDPSQRSRLVLSDGLVELIILGILDLRGFTGPDGLRLVAQLPIPCGLVNLKNSTIKLLANNSQKP